MGWEYELGTDIRYLQGIEKKNIQVVTNLLVNNEFNFDVNTIADFAGVSVEFVENIKKNLDKKSHQNIQGVAENCNTLFYAKLNENIHNPNNPKLRKNP